MRVEKSYRGISERLACHYLANLGGEVEGGDAPGAGGSADRSGGPADRSAVGSTDCTGGSADRTGDSADRAAGGPADRADGPADRADVVGDGWRATVSSESVEIGPSMTLTEVTVVFEGDEDALDDLVEDFSRKALRAGG